ncbi:DNA-3-methyladenine glycosylase 2 [Planctomonas psychrotolerans]|uniref:DNA-3-methyladenine glycosylase 2 n=1 Tax=Planctomonas psychrotolerans TaxID=2528712 RepID=UPI001D0D6436|nr:DNA-3-methyladenine glycosylase 2 [Planctomonas psychrotolerans]
MTSTGESLFAERYRAMSSRDARFDGQFITGVHSTGIYCRPSCPATTPRASNVSFYSTAAAAQRAGLRACKRCLPDAVPGSPEWNMRNDLAGRAMRLILDGTVEREGVPGLARQLGYTPRHLTRVLVAELGAGPQALARAHRASTARLLLLNTALPITEVAFASGFASVRSFNETISAVYERSPSELRALRPVPAATGGRGSAPSATAAVEAGSAPTTITLRLPARAPFDAEGIFGFLASHAALGMESGTADEFTQALRLPHGFATATLRRLGTEPAIECEARLEHVDDLAPLVARVRRLFDLDADAEAIDAVLAADPALAASVRRTPGIRIPGSIDPHATLFRTVVGQQISVAAAVTTHGRLVQELGDPLPPGLAGTVTHVFPTAERIAEHGHEVLRGPKRRIETMLHLAEQLASGALRVDTGVAADALHRSLVALPGIGPWTAGYASMRILGSPDVLLSSDLIVRQGAARLGLPDGIRALEAHAGAWAPWRSYATLHLWRAITAGARVASGT